MMATILHTYLRSIIGSQTWDLNGFHNWSEALIKRVESPAMWLFDIVIAKDVDEISQILYKYSYGDFDKEYVESFLGCIYLQYKLKKITRDEFAYLLVQEADLQTIHAVYPIDPEGITSLFEETNKSSIEFFNKLEIFSDRSKQYLDYLVSFECFKCEPELFCEN